MKSLLLICIASLLCTCNALAQPYQQKADSLKKLLETAKSDTARNDLMGSIAIAYARMGKFQVAHEFANKALTLAHKQSYPYYEAQARYSLGNIYMLSFVMDSAIIQYDAVRSLLRDGQAASRALYLRTTINLAQAWFNKSFHEKGAALLTEILPELEKGNDKEAYAASLHNLSAAFITLKQYPKAHPYLLKDIKLAEQANAGKDSKAQSYLNAALLMYYMDSVSSLQSYLDKAERQLKLLGKDRLWTRFYSYEAFSYVLQKQPGKASEAVRRAFSNLAVYPDRETEYDAYESRKTVEAAEGNYKVALASARVIEKMAAEDELPEYMLPALKDIATYARLSGNIEMAYAYLEKYTRFKDSIDKQQTVFKIDELELRYQSAQKEHKIVDLQARSEIQKLLLGFSLALSLLLLLFFLYRSRQKKKLARQQMQTLQQQRQVEVAQALIAGEERERGRLARDLHDGLGGMLAGVKMNLSRMTEKEQLQHQEELHTTIDQLGRSVNELRRISRNMMPEALIRSGLMAAVKDMCDQLTTQGMRIQFNAFGLDEKSIPAGTQLAVYRIVQELVSNAAKHSGAGKIIVQCSMEENTLFITVEDNGKGFDIAKEYDGMGLSNIRNRVDFLKGSMQIDSSNEGTVINIELYAVS